MDQSQVNFKSARVLFATLVMFLIALAYGFAQEAADNDLVVLHLGNTTITQSEFDARFKTLASVIAERQGVPINEQTLGLFDTFRSGYLEQLANEVVLLNEAAKRGISVSAEEVDDQVGQMRESAGSEEAFMQMLERAGFADEARLRQALHDTMTVQKMLGTLGEEIDVSDGAIERWYEDHLSELEQPAEVCALHILVNEKAQAEDLARQLQEEDADFGILAEEHSLDTISASRGGDLGCFAEGVMVPTFEEAAFSLNKGETSEPVETQFGYHLIQIYDSHEADVLPLEAVHDRIRQRVQEEELNNLVASLRDGSGIEVFPENIAIRQNAE